MNKIILCGLFAASAMAAHADPFTVATSGDTLINNAGTSNPNKAFGGDLSGTANSTSQMWLKFSGAALQSAIGSGTLTSLGLQLSVSEANDNSQISFYFNSNATWQTDGAAHTNQNAATTTYLTYNNSGQPGATNSRFLGTTTQIGSMTIPTRAGVLLTNQMVSLTLAPELLTAINNGTDFTIFAVSSNFNTTTTNGRLSAVFTEGVSAFQTGGGFPSAAAPMLVGNVSTVPEPATMCVIGLGVVALAKRRRSN
jgi:hypothetical protein